jgi:hypothetical protein
MPDSVLSEDFEVLPLLADMDLDKNGLIESVRYADAERALCTGNDVNGFAAMTVYDKTARALRERYCGGPWEKDDTDNQAGIRHPVKKLRIVPCNFDINAGNLLVQPTNRSEKGEVSRGRARCNATGWLPNLPDIPAQDRHDFKTWILGIYAADRQPLRAELSFPVEFNGKYFTRFARRIILLRGDEDENLTKGRRGGEGPTDIVDIAIVRK